MYLAWLSRATGIRTAAIAHTIYPPILLGLSYSAYYEIGSQLFAGKRKIHERGIFLLMVSIINLFIGTYMRQYTGDIDIMYGRNIDGFIQQTSKEAQTVHSQLIDPEGDLELVATILANEGFDYLVLDDTDRKSIEDSISEGRL